MSCSLKLNLGLPGMAGMAGMTGMTGMTGAYVGVYGAAETKHSTELAAPANVQTWQRNAIR